MLGLLMNNRVVSNMNNTYSHNVEGYDISNRHPYLQVTNTAK